MKHLIALTAMTLTLALACQQQPEAAAPAAPAPVQAAGTDGVQTVDLKITGGVYEPASIQVKAGVPLRLQVTRDEKPSCGDVLVIPSQNISRPIPVNQMTTIEFTPQQAGDLEFTCGMNMMRGKIVVQS